MRAWVVREPGPIKEHPLALTAVPIPTPGSGEVLVRVRACGICRTDLHVVEGELPLRRPRITPGHQVVGELENGQRVGVAWLHHTCGHCRFCRAGRENLCEQSGFTGWTEPGGFAEYVIAREDFIFPIPDGFSEEQAAPLLCAGIIGYRCLRLAEIGVGARLGIYGFGAAGHIGIQLARARGAEVYVCTRDHDRHQKLAHELGATWVGGTVEVPPVPLDASIVFAPAGEIVPPALRALDKGGRLVLGGIHMSPIPEFSYDWLYGERVIRSVTNNTRDDGREFLAEAARIPVRTHVQVFPFEKVNEALLALKTDAIAGAGVIRVS